MSTSVRAASGLLSSAIDRRVFPGAVAEVGTSHDVIWREALGALTFDADAGPTQPHTIFDLASLTKPIATTTLALTQVDSGRLRLDSPVGGHFPEWRGNDRSAVTVRHLLDHSSGLSARLLDAPPHSAREFVHEICASPLEYEPATRAVYSDLGFILLGIWLEDIAAQRLSSQASQVCGEIVTAVTRDPDALLLSDVDPALADRVAPTRPLPEDRRTGRLFQGEVHDTYAWELGGFAGHAGLFGTASGVGAFARFMLALVRGEWRGTSPMPAALAQMAVARSAVPGSSRALGWDTMVPTSSCGAHLSRRAFGHVGFTGTSVWIDPERDRYYVLLTNRVCGDATTNQMQEVRRAFHDALSAL